MSLRGTSHRRLLSGEEKDRCVEIYKMQRYAI
jgi:hypothetical protein